MDGIIHVSVWVFFIVVLALGALAALAWKNKKTPVVEGETLLGEAKAEIQGFDTNVYNTLKQLEAESKADVGTAAKYVESIVGFALKKV